MVEPGQTQINKNQLILHLWNEAEIFILKEEKISLNGAYSALIFKYFKGFNHTSNSGIF